MFKRIPYMWKWALLGVGFGIIIPVICVAGLVILGGASPGLSGVFSEGFSLVLLIVLVPILVMNQYVTSSFVVHLLFYFVWWAAAFAIIGKCTEGKSKKKFWIALIGFLVCYFAIAVTLLTSVHWTAFVAR